MNTITELRPFVSEARLHGRTLALIPTMGALHDGHLSLVKEGLARADICIVSIFVNPAQFGPNEDFDAYPRTWDTDREKLEQAGAYAIFYPGAKEMYPDGFATTIHVSGITEPLEGAHRPGHFDGVATVVTKLLLQTLPDMAVFGEKDYQQLLLVKKLAADLNIPVEIIGAPTVRDENGLALSSRNAYLSEEQYRIAATLNKTLFALAENIAAGKTDFHALEQEAEAKLLAAGFDEVEYVAIRNAQTLQPPTSEEEPLRILAAVRIGKTRLIDNVKV